MFEILTKIIELCLTAIGLCFVAFGWIVPYRQSLKTEEKKRNYEIELHKRQWKKQLLDEQISILYGPLSALIYEQKVRWMLVLYQLGRGYVFSKDQHEFSQLEERDQRIWKHYVDNYKIPIQMQMVEIMQRNQHLFYQMEKPEGYNKFMEYVLGWELLDNQKRNDVPNYYEYYYRFNYPHEFDLSIQQTLEALSKQREEFIRLDD